MPASPPRAAPLAPRERLAPPDLDPETGSEVGSRLVSLGKDRAAHEREVCRWLLAAQRLGVHARVGYASLASMPSACSA